MQSPRIEWSGEEAAEAFSSLITPADEVVFIHSNLAFLGRPTGGSAPELIWRALSRFESTTFVLPAFSYSFGKGERFDIENPPSAMGALTSFAFGQKNVQRTRDPMFSCLISGPLIRELSSTPIKRSFGPGSLFDRVLNSKGKFLSINLDMGSTLCHELEFRARVPFRFEKEFVGYFQDKPLTPVKWVSYVRDLNKVGRQEFSKLTEQLERSELLHEARLGRGRVRSIDLADYSSFVQEMLERDPWSLISRL